MKGDEELPRRLPFWLRPGHWLLRLAGRAGDRLFTHPLNPLHQLGALAWFFFWVLAATGIYLYLFYEMSPAGAYDSVERITYGQRWLGGVVRSLHRYASAGLMLTAVVHMGQALFAGRVRRKRRLAWFTGLIALPFVWFEGATGYVMVWDETGKGAAIEFAKWFDAFPLAVEPFSRNFVPGGSMSPLFFFLLSYLHLLFPCVLVILLWVHNLRQTLPITRPRAPLGWALMAALCILSLALPAQSGPPADIFILTGSVRVDWFYLAVFPVAHAWGVSPLWLWSSFALVWGGLALLPRLMPEEQAEPDAAGGEGE